MTEGLIGEGAALKFGDDISTDLIAPGRYFYLRSNLPELAKHVLEDATLLHTKQKFTEVMSKGDYVVGGENFGLGSSREHAPTIIKNSGIRAVLAKSFARIFFRNAINIGLLVLQCDTDKIESNDLLEVNLKQGVVINKSQDIRLSFQPLPEIMVQILLAGGLVDYVNKNQGLVLPSA